MPAEFIECYPTVFLTIRDVWVLVHFLNPMVLELYLRNWSLSFFFVVLWEFIETWVVMLFQSYLIFITDNEDVEAVTHSYLGDVGIGLVGILMVVVIRHFFMYTPQLLVRPRDSVKLFVYGVIQLILVIGLDSLAVIVGKLIHDPGTTTVQPAAILFIVVLVISMWVLYRWTVQNHEYMRIVWRGYGTRAPRRVFLVFGIMFVLLAIPFYVAFQYSQTITYIQGSVIILIVLALGVKWSSIRYTPSTLYYGDERELVAVK